MSSGGPVRHILSAGTYPLAVASAPQWCEVTRLPSSVTIEHRQVASVVIEVDCVGGFVYTTESEEMHLITSDGHDIPFDHQQSHLWLEGWAPNGGAFAYRLGWEMRIYHLDTRVTPRLDAGGSLRDRDLTWSPDGEWVAWTRGLDWDAGGDAEILVARRDGGMFRRLIGDGGGPDVEPAWSPDGSTIAFGSQRNSIDRTLHSVAPDGTGLVELDDRFAGAPRWSPDGRWISFSSFTPELSINAMKTDGSGRRIVRTLSTSHRWSPVANRFLYEDRTHDDYLGHWVYDVETGTRSHLVDMEPVEWIDWSGDGAWLMFTTRTPGVATIWIIRPDGTGLREVLRRPGWIRQVMWDPTVRQD